MLKLRLLREGEEYRLRNARRRGGKIRAYAVMLSQCFRRSIDVKTGEMRKIKTLSPEDITGDTQRAAMDVREAIINFRRALARLRNAIGRYRELRQHRMSQLARGQLQALNNEEDRVAIRK